MALRTASISLWLISGNSRNAASATGSLIFPCPCGIPLKSGDRLVLRSSSCLAHNSGYTSDFSLLSNRLLDALQVIDWDKTRVLSETIHHAISTTVLQTHESIAANDDFDLENYLRVLESVEPYMPEDVNAEIKQKIVEPLAKTEKVTIDTKLSIVSIVLTILIFLYGQVVDHKKEEENQKLIGSLAQTIQQLSDEVSELSYQLEQSKEVLSKAEDTQCDTDQRDCLHETEAVDPT